MKNDLILLHGALGSERQMFPLKERLENDFVVHTLNFEGHGQRTSENPLGIEHFSENLVGYIRENQLEQPDVFGYSMGGYVALYTDALHSGLLGKIMTLGTKFNWTPESSAKEVKMLNPEIIEEKVPHFASHLQKMHAPNDWKVNMRETAGMMLRMGEKPPLHPEIFKKVGTEVLLTRGGKDQMVSEEETRFVLNHLSNATLKQFDSFEHPMEKVDLSVLSNAIKAFMQ